VTTMPAMGSALALGLLTTLYPCTMATSLTALSWMAASAHDVRRTARAGLLYALGRAFTYTCLGLLLSRAALSHVQVTAALQHYGNACWARSSLLPACSFAACCSPEPGTARPGCWNACGPAGTTVRFRPLRWAPCWPSRSVPPARPSFSGAWL